jgi:hypothetical protein
VEPPLPPVELPAEVVGAIKEDSSDPPHEASTIDNAATTDQPKSDANVLIFRPHKLE